MIEHAKGLDRHTEPLLGEVNKVLEEIEAKYGLSRADAIGCLKEMAYALERYRPGDNALKEAFYDGVGESANNFEQWALKVGRDVIGWRNHA